jgi:hypothetical protein
VYKGAWFARSRAHVIKYERTMRFQAYYEPNATQSSALKMFITTLFVALA